MAGGSSSALRAAVVAVLFACASLAHAQVPRNLHYQGFLTNSAGAPANGATAITFKLYSAASGGSPLWTEAHASVSVANGHYQALLGNTTPLDLQFDAPYWLGVTVGADAEMTPRQPLASAPYALNPGPIKRAVHGCFPGQANASGSNYAVTYTGAGAQYAVAIADGALQTAAYTVLVDARTSKGRSYSLVASGKTAGGITLTGGWLDDDGETVASICFMFAE